MVPLSIFSILFQIFADQRFFVGLTIDNRFILWFEVYGLSEGLQDSEDFFAL